MNNGRAPHGAEDAPKVGDVEGDGVTEKLGIGLIERLERATGPDRELDGMIWLLTFGAADGWLELSTINGNWCAYEPNGKGGGRLSEPKKGQPRQCSPFTSSLDTAMTLVPEGWEWKVSNRALKPHAGRAYIHNRELINIGGGMRPNPKYRGQEATAASPVIALCIAALKARATP